MNPHNIKGSLSHYINETCLLKNKNKESSFSLVKDGVDIENYYFVSDVFCFMIQSAKENANFCGKKMEDGGIFLDVDDRVNNLASSFLSFYSIFHSTYESIRKYEYHKAASLLRFEQENYCITKALLLNMKIVDGKSVNIAYLSEDSYHSSKKLYSIITEIVHHKNFDFNVSHFGGENNIISPMAKQNIYSDSYDDLFFVFFHE